MDREMLKIMDELAVHEECMEQLYRQYELCFPEHAAVWNKLVEGEAKHARMIRKFKEWAEEGRLLIKPERFNLEILKDSQQQIRDEISSSAQNTPPISEALAFALLLERSYFEKKFFDIIDGDQEKYRELFNFLSEDSHSHYLMLEAVLLQIKKADAAV